MDTNSRSWSLLWCHISFIEIDFGCRDGYGCFQCLKGMVVYTNFLHDSLRDKTWFMVVSESTRPLGRWKNTLNPSMSWKANRKRNHTSKWPLKQPPKSSNTIQLKWIDFQSMVSVFILKPLLPRRTSVHRCHESWGHCEKKLWCYPF